MIKSCSNCYWNMADRYEIPCLHCWQEETNPMWQSNSCEGCRWRGNIETQCIDCASFDLWQEKQT